jgi:hypothetical protein
VENTEKNISPSYIIKDDRFDTTLISEYHLCIEIKSDHFRFAVFSEPSQTFMWLEDYQTTLLWGQDKFTHFIKEIIKDHAFLGANYWRSIQIITHSDAFTMVPTDLFQPNDMAKYITFVTGKVPSPLEQILEYSYTTFRAHTVFSVESNLTSWIKSTYQSRAITPIHLSSIWIEGVLRQANPDGFHIYFEGDAVILLYIKEGKVTYCNRFIYRTADDLVYYVLFVMHVLSIDADAVILFYGEITTFADNYVMLAKSLPNIQFASSPTNVKFSQYFYEIPEHRYFALFSLKYLIY